MILSRFLVSPVTKKHIERKVIEAHPIHLFRIIQDVDKYEKFLPLCSFSKVIQRSPDGRTFEGKLVVGAGIFVEEYVSRVTVIPETLTILSESIQSTKFDSLKSRWTLHEIESDKNVHCDVDFEVEMTVSDPLIVATLDQILQKVAGYQVKAFEKRCHELPVPYDLIEAAKRLKQ